MILAVLPDAHMVLNSQEQAILRIVRKGDTAALHTWMERAPAIRGGDWLAQTASDFSIRHPGIEIRFLQGSSSEFYALLSEHAVDFCIVSRREGAYDFHLLKTDPLVAWIPADHPCTKKAYYSLADFEKDPYIDTFPGQDTDNNRAFLRYGLAPRGQFLSVDVQATRAMVAAGLGVSLNNSILSHGLNLSGIAVLPTQPRYDVEIGIAAPCKSDRSPAAEYFLQYALNRLPLR